MPGFPYAYCKGCARAIDRSSRRDGGDCLVPREGRPKEKKKSKAAAGDTALVRSRRSVRYLVYVVVVVGVSNAIVFACFDQLLRIARITH